MMIKHLSRCLLLPLVLVSQFALASESIDKQVKVDEGLNLNIKVLRGDVTIQSWDKQEVSIQGTLDELSEGFIVEHQGNELTLEDKMPRQFNGKNKEGSLLTFKVPRSLNLTVSGLSADYKVTQVQGGISINSISGSVHLDSLDKQVYIKTVSGDINATALKGEISLQTVSGDIIDKQSKGEVSYKLVSGELTADSLAKDVTIEQVSGDTNIKLASLNSLAVRTISGEVELTAESISDKATLSSVSGDLELTLNDGTDARFKINGGPGGRINNQLTSDKPSKEKYSPTSYLKFSLGDALANIDISTISGEITLKKH
ncbi:DUF4097 family beta strand repeat-containing protein [Shewanella woodyi]|uniref:DUF4097 family beta strand repeat-containing protein n=1 Tax=Shewanella woodyi TaxID=60961 RepID=UPI0007F957E0|nr:DUF4097 family beta strand repeat-containing protein [Shewanella woodyi]